MRSKKQIVAAMQYLAKTHKHLFFSKTENNYCLYHDKLPFHCTIMKLTCNGDGTWKILDLSSKLLENNYR